MQLRTPAILLLCTSIVSIAHAQEPSEDATIAEIRELVLYARYDDALTRAQEYLQRSDLSASQRNAGIEIVATVQIAKRRSADAEQTLQLLYARDPGHRITDPDASPVLMSTFGRVRANPPEPLDVELEVDVPDLTRRTPPAFTVSARGVGADAVAELRLHYQQGSTEYATMLMRWSGDAANARLPLLDDTDAYEVRYYIAAHAPSGALLTTVGSENDPLTFTVPAATPLERTLIEDTPTTTVTEESRSLWWVGLLVGIAVAGAGAGVAIALTRDDGARNGSLGNIQLPLASF